jgi:peroxiredoxin
MSTGEASGKDGQCLSDLARQIRSIALVALAMLWIASDLLPEALGQSPRVSRFSLPDVQGKLHQPSEWQGAKAVVLLFLGTECPISNGYAPEMARLAGEFGSRGVLFYGVHCDPDVTAPIAAAHAKDFSLVFPLLLDPRQVLPPQTGAKRTPEAVLLSPAGDILYRGRIDDRYAAPGKLRPEPTVRDLQTAIEAVLAGQKPAVQQTEAVGCPLPKAAPASAQ